MIANRCCDSPETHWIRERLLGGKVPCPYEKRFAALILFLEALLPLEELSKCFDPEKFDTGSAKQAQEDVFVDMSKTSKAILSKNYRTMREICGFGLWLYSCFFDGFVDNCWRLTVCGLIGCMLFGVGCAMN